MVSPNPASRIAVPNDAAYVSPWRCRLIAWLVAGLTAIRLFFPVVAAVCFCGCTRLPVVSADRLMQTLESSEPSVAPLVSERTDFGQPISQVDYQGDSPAGTFSLSDVIAYARANHPRAIAAARLIEQSEAAARVAGAAENPEFVLDLDTPVHQKDDPTELSTRLTFPIGQSHRRRALLRSARTEIAKSHAEYQATLRRLGEEALSAGLRLAYLQQRVELDRQALEIAKQRVTLLSPESRDGDAAGKLIDSLDASGDVRKATQAFFTTQKEVDLARATLASAMGLDPRDNADLIHTVRVDAVLEPVSLALPPFGDVIDAAVKDSALLAAARWATQKGRVDAQSARQAPVAMEVGPRYQDRLGDDDDTVGIRFQTDVPVNRDLGSAIAVAEIEARMLEDQYQLSQHEIASVAARDYLELESIAKQLEADRSDPFVAQQQERLGDAQTRDLLSGEQSLRIEAAILDRQRDRLELAYRFAVLRSKLRLHALPMHAFPTSAVH